MRQVYLDNSSATKLHPEVAGLMASLLKEHLANPSSLHGPGRRAKEVLDEARGQVAGLIGAGPEEIIFTSSGTEANNLAMKGMVMAYKNKGKHIITSEIEHFSVLNPLARLEKMGFNVTKVPVDSTGLVDPADVEKAVTPETIFASIMLANGEMGTIEPIKDIAAVLKKKGVLLHTDAIAAVGNIPVDVNELGVGALSLSANQFYGPMGAGALFVRKGVRVRPQIDGGVQEGGKRAGAENLLCIAGMGKAAELAAEEMPERAKKLASLRDSLRDKITQNIDYIHLTGHPTKRLPGSLSLCVEFVEGESLLLFLDMQGIAVTSGSACTSRALKASHVLLAMGVDIAVAQGSLHLSLGSDITEEDVDHVAEAMPPIAERLRQMSPLYEKVEKEVKA
ncbi:MAG: cysteine desulfurase family protein [Planctomycetota bacterium]|jgi:cysteine desulfurase